MNTVHKAAAKPPWLSGQEVAGWWQRAVLSQGSPPAHADASAAAAAAKASAYSARRLDEAFRLASSWKTRLSVIGG